MAPEKLSNEELQRRILETDFETRQLGLERQREENQIFTQTREQRERVRKSHQEDLVKEATLRESIQRACLHRQGGGPEDRYEGDGKSALVLSRVFFSNNFLIQCPRCDLAIQRPHPKRKSTKPLFEGETQAQIKERVKLYAEDVARYEGLLRDAKSNKLRPMLGPTWEFADEEGNTFIPEPK